MPPETSRRRLLGSFAAAVGVGPGAGCLSDPADLRVRNFSETAVTIRVEIATDAGETLVDSEYELGPREQATEEEVYHSPGTYAVTVTVDDETTSDEITLDNPDIPTHVTVHDDGVNIGRNVP